MKLILLTLALVSLAAAKQVDFEDVVVPNTAYDYLEKVGLPLARKIRTVEETYHRSRGSVGSYIAEPGQFPYHAGLIATFAGGEAACSGALISSNRVVTVAHCYNDGRHVTTNFMVVLGSTFLYSGGTRISTNYVVVHEGWSPINYKNDIAMIYLPTRVSLSDMIDIVNMPTGAFASSSFEGYPGLISGYLQNTDVLESNIATARSLRFFLDVVAKSESCEGVYTGFDNTTNICSAGTPSESPCTSNSGSPYVASPPMKGRLLIGLLSFGSSSGCTKTGPAAFTRITAYQDFISDNL